MKKINKSLGFYCIFEDSLRQTVGHTPAVAVQRGDAIRNLFYFWEDEKCISKIPKAFHQVTLIIVQLRPLPIPIKAT